MEAFNHRLVIFLFASAILIKALEANIAVFDEVWQKRAEEAKKAANEAYNPDPENVAKDFNRRIHEDSETNSTRRNLRKARKGGPCLATNPIDRCWRCRTDWATDRKRLAGCALGFGRRTTGGKDGKLYVVTNPSDSDTVNPQPGTLRYAVIQPYPLWIIFAHDMVIRLSQELMMTDNKTIDARGANVRICNGAQITIQFVKNVIIHGLHIHDIQPGNGGMIRDSVDHFGYRTRSDGDGISIYGSTNIWIDHLSMSKCYDGLIDAIQASTAITISNCHFTNHNEVMLFGGSDSYSGDEKMQITVAFNHFGRGLTQRMPRCRWGFIHVVNNDYTHWLMDYAPESVWKSWNWRSEGDLLLNGAFFVQSGSPFTTRMNKKDVIKAKPGTFVTRLTRFAGSLDCVPNKPC
ncbi:hypothetical protein CRG98_046007 [Punica granatum]|uniref:Pectate lyase n=1 Tax=Punica granatum TaxID=22663 RepID=A0A2I0HQP5_PUNGR|nr:hypothetical protein CRG98_046007 [Punica granatum]